MPTVTDQHHRAAVYLRDLASHLDRLASSVEPVDLDALTNDLAWMWDLATREMRDVLRLDARWVPAAGRVERHAAGAAWLRVVAGALTVERAESAEVVA